MGRKGLGRRGGCGIAASSLLLTACPLLRAAEIAPGWETGFTFVPYGWLAGFEGEIGSASADIDPGGDIELPERVDVQVDGELEEIGFMFYGEWRGERTFVFFDSVWANVTQDAEIGLGLLPSSMARAGFDGNVYQLAAGYRMNEWPSQTFSLYGGLRYYDLEATAHFEGGLLPQPVSVTSTGSWTDGVVGARWEYRLAEKWRGHVRADVGFGEEDMSWQVFASVAWRFNGWGALAGGYRWLAIDYEAADYKADLTLQGPAIGIAVRF